VTDPKKNDAPSAPTPSSHPALSKTTRYLTGDFVAIKESDAVEVIETVIARVRREARAEAFEEGATACHYVGGELREINPDRTQVLTASDICAMRLYELAAKERAK
jgi:hypothetical protein